MHDVAIEPRSLGPTIGLASCLLAATLFACARGTPERAAGRSEPGDVAVAATTTSIAPQPSSEVDSGATLDAGLGDATDDPYEARPVAADGGPFDADRFLARAAPLVTSCIAENSTPLPYVPGASPPRHVFDVTYVLKPDGHLDDIIFVRPSGHGQYVDECAVRRMRALRLPPQPAPFRGRFSF
ncbi:MAG TPA: hypothetical protein VIJ22_16755 [Polyangiaceae bacterium]